MCSIIGYTGDTDAAPILVHGLSRMEYRGYDSSGVATAHNNKIVVRKGVGGVSVVNETASLDSISGRMGIGHTRWATHGDVSKRNAHPHLSGTGRLALVHNGMVENYDEIKAELAARGFSFRSDTDTEVLADLLQTNYDESGDILAAVLKTTSRIRGDYAFTAILDDGTLVASRLHIPLIIGVGERSYFVSSDVLGFIERTDDAIYLDNGDIAVIDSCGLKLYDQNGREISRQITKVSKEFADVYKGEFAHFTLKEIFEQPDAILRSSAISDDQIRYAADMIRGAKTVYMTGSGTSYNTARVARYLLSKHTDVRVELIVSSEMPFSHELKGPDSVLVAISQSGESADVLRAVDIAKNVGARIISIVNIPHSSLAQKTDCILAMNCGPEIGVAATKSFVAQLAIAYRLVNELGGNAIKIDFEEIALSVGEMLGSSEEIIKIAKDLQKAADVYVLGRGLHYPVAAETALKLKELAYIHAEGIPGGELKHGPLALIDSDTYVVVINPTGSTYQDMTNSTQEIKVRGARIIGISDRRSDLYDHWIRIPSMSESVYPIVEIIPIQLLAYYTALRKNVDPDRPRNLAKSVTVR